MRAAILFFWVLVTSHVGGDLPSNLMLNEIEKVQKTIGIIGGTSWESTALYYELINQQVRDRLGGLSSAKLLVHSLNYEPIEALEDQGNWGEVEKLLGEAAKVLEDAGADLIILSCNTLHKVAPYIESRISTPFCHIAVSAGKALVAAEIKKVGLLGTQFTMEDGFYSSKLKDSFDLEVVTPDLVDRQLIDKIIYRELCLGTVSLESKSEILRIIEKLQKQGAEAILLGCTELGILIKQGDIQIPIFDTTLLHVRDVVEFSFD